MEPKYKITLVPLCRVNGYTHIDLRSTEGVREWGREGEREIIGNMKPDYVQKEGVRE